MNNIILLDLITLEKIRIDKLWKVRDSRPTEPLDLFITNQELINENRKDFNEIFERFAL